MKTLKDFDPEPCCHGINERELKQEAINWVKELRREFEEQLINYDMPIVKIAEIQVNSITKWIANFFNITEEDLK